ncbi:MAG: helix-hairpin-helix domain-containing protein [Bacteroidales bacterium]|nr:helix-hairpin-helix domain-containing protein [Bacteroidales bacterium]
MNHNSNKYKYTLSQKIIFTAIACIIFSSVIFNKFYSGKNSDTFMPDSALIARVEAFENSLIPIDTARFHSYNNNYPSHSSSSEATLPPKRLFCFNPNEIDSFGMLELGFQPYMAHNALQYRRRGGSINNERKFKQIFNIDTALITELRPYTLYPSPENIVDSTKIKHQKHYFTFDLNTADTLTLSQLPGISIGRAKMIINYKRKLGGYTSAQQLLEIEEIPDSIITPLMQYATANLDSIKTIKINKTSIRGLLNHPYINYDQAKEIYQLRWDKAHNGTLKEEDLRQLKQLTPTELNKLLPYLDFTTYK